MVESEQAHIQRAVALSLAEDVGAGDITAVLIDSSVHARASITCKEAAVICGIPWANAVFQQLDPTVCIEWQVADGDWVSQDQTIADISGPARSVLTGERCALNWLQTLSATATKVSRYMDIIKDTRTVLLDSRKTIPGLRLAQKYAVRCGGGKNHRMGLYDAYLIKENHILSCGSIEKAVQRARQLSPNKPVEVEVENVSELSAALATGADIIMLDNFSHADVITAIEMNQGQAKLEVSGNIGSDRLLALAKLGVDYISMGDLTKNVQAIDLSMRVAMV